MTTATVVGAGIFGVCVADALQAAGLTVTLVDASAPGHDFASSGGHTRVIRSGHGDERGDWYVGSARRAWGQWHALQERLGEQLLFPVGCTWLASSAGGIERDAYLRLGELGVPASWLAPAELRAQHPRVRVDGLAGALFEPEAGVVRAGPAVAALATDLERRGVRLVRGTALPDAAGRPVLVEDAPARLAVSTTRGAACAGTTPGSSAGRPPTAATVAHAVPPVADAPRESSLDADVVVWAAGAWLGRLFPTLAPVRAARREYVYLDPPGDWRPDDSVLIDVTAGIYVLPDVHGAGVKVADDLGAHPLDLDATARPPDPAVEARLRAYAGERLPSLAGARRRGGRVCAYELTPDDGFLAGPHPETPHVWLVGGGSGHGFKHGPAFGADVAHWILTDTPPPAAFALGERTHAGATLRASPALRKP